VKHKDKDNETETIFVVTGTRPVDYNNTKSLFKKQVRTLVNECLLDQQCISVLKLLYDKFETMHPAIHEPSIVNTSIDISPVNELGLQRLAERKYLKANYEYLVEDEIIRYNLIIM